MSEEYGKIVQDMYRSSKTQVVTQKGETEYFPIEVGLHQGSALSPLLFIITIDVLLLLLLLLLRHTSRTLHRYHTRVLMDNTEKDPPLAMMFADDLVLSAMTREKVEEDLETCIVVFERRELKISRPNTEYLPTPTSETKTTEKIVDAELPT